MKKITLSLLLFSLLGTTVAFAEESQEDTKVKTEECIQFAADPKADLGAVILSVILHCGGTSTTVCT
jgi:hypothetical protein